MLVIRNQRDLIRLLDDEKLDNELEANIYDYLELLQEELDEFAPGEFKVEDTGQVVILEAGDDVRDLAAIGLNKEDRGILGAIPEWMDQVCLDGISYYRFLVIYNDSFGTTFYCPAGVFDEEVERWLQAKVQLYDAI